MKQTYWGKRDLAESRYGANTRKMGFEFLSIMSVRKGILPLLICIIQLLFYFNCTLLRSVFLMELLISAIIITIHLVFRDRINHVGSIVMAVLYIVADVRLLIYSGAAVNLDYLERLFLGLSIDENNIKFSNTLFILFIVFAVLDVVLLILESYFSYRDERIKNLSESSKLEIYEDKLSGIAVMYDKYIVSFTLNFTDILSVDTETVANINNTLSNLNIRAKDGRTYGLSLSDNIGAREEIKYIMDMVNKGQKPYPKKQCEKCGFYIIDGRCPNCEKPSV